MMGLQDILRFGKYRGLSVAAVIRFDPGYLGWVRENLRGVSFDADAIAALKPALREEREQSLQRQNGWAWGFGREVREAASKRRARAIRIEHEERRLAGQETCHCFPNNWGSCGQCGGTGWTAIADQSPKGRDAERLDAKHASGGAEGNRPTSSGIGAPS